ncbi:hypothetical protein ABIE71_006906 [Bradyrhizobium diazoefficiens]
MNSHHVRQGQHGAAGAVMRRLHCDQAGTFRAADRVCKRRFVHCAATARHGLRHQPRDRHDAAELGVEQVRTSVGEYLCAALGMGEHRQEIAHRAARHEQGSFLAGQRGAARFERADGRVALAAVVAERGPLHALQHRGRR